MVVAGIRTAAAVAVAMALYVCIGVVVNILRNVPETCNLLIFGTDQKTFVHKERERNFIFTNIEQIFRRTFPFSKE